MKSAMIDFLEQKYPSHFAQVWDATKMQIRREHERNDIYV